MAPPVTTVLTVARTGSKVVRYLIRPAVKRVSLSREVRGAGGTLADWAADPWSPAARLQRGASLTRRALGLGVLALLSVLGAALLTLCVVLLGLGVASGSDVAGWVLGFTLLLGVVGAVWVARRAGTLLRAEAQDAGTLPPHADDETQLRQTLRAGVRALPAPARAALQRTVLATRDALWASSGDSTLERDTYDVRQTVREDLPALLDAYRAVPRTRQSDAELTRQLALIETRMQRVTLARAAQHERQLQAHGRYLDDKHSPDRDNPEP
ncbi:hypothetical protein [Deinococcus koreensis]|uniref:Uncharacterized protein n=1 Tax=Deinococcus koreensis TaxID=2054903 RepID=A0A2K3V0D6_9DEIO|nr:hypothetical protein [Deinococcus koreensis]PNY82232.1 hypothetical protein CVO96_13475 [Deinococcus koreensis]